MTSIHDALAMGDEIENILTLYSINEVPKFVTIRELLNEERLIDYCSAARIGMDDLKKYDTLMVVYYLDGNLIIQNCFPNQLQTTAIGIYENRNLEEAALQIASNSHLPANAAILYFGKDPEKLKDRIYEKIRDRLNK